MSEVFSRQEIDRRIFATPEELELEEVMNRRRRDWRMGGVIYQVIVDRFAPSRRMREKKALYAEPRRLRSWNEIPAPGKYLQDHRVSEQEVEFWGGDLDSLLGKIDYIQDLGVDVLYLNPIFKAFTNHKYDGGDYGEIDPQYGTMEELERLTEELHGRGMRLILDGVFNHIGRRSELFQKAQADPASPEREFFFFGDQYRNGYRGWRAVANLPELDLENPEVRRYLFEAPDSIVQRYLTEVGIDGWRLDVAPDLGFVWLKALTEAAHAVRPDSVVIGECWNYPEAWLKVVDGILNMHVRKQIFSFVKEEVSVQHTARCLERLVSDCDYEGLLRTHMLLDNHDTPRLEFMVEDEKARHLAEVLQFTLPGSPSIYYGTEVGMEGGHDPTNRAPMRWDLVTEDNHDYQFIRKLVAVHQECDALRIGEYRQLDAENCLAFLRHTEKVCETVIVLVNPSRKHVRDEVPIRFSKLMDTSRVECLLTGERAVLDCGVLEVSLPPQSARLFRPVEHYGGGYSEYKRIY